jgi:hypothetical protein
MSFPHPNSPADSQPRRWAIESLNPSHRETIIRSEALLPHEILTDPHQSSLSSHQVRNPSLVWVRDGPELAEKLLNRFSLLLSIFNLRHTILIGTSIFAKCPMVVEVDQSHDPTPIQLTRILSL